MNVQLFISTIAIYQKQLNLPIHISCIFKAVDVIPELPSLHKHVTETQLTPLPKQSLNNVQVPPLSQ